MCLAFRQKQVSIRYLVIYYFVLAERENLKLNIKDSSMTFKINGLYMNIYLDIT